MAGPSLQFQTKYEHHVSQSTIAILMSLIRLVHVWHLDAAFEWYTTVSIPYQRSKSLINRGYLSVLYYKYARLTEASLHITYSCGRSPECLRTRCFKLPDWLNALLYITHSCGCSPECLRMVCIKLPVWQNLITCYTFMWPFSGMLAYEVFQADSLTASLHITHSCGRSPECLRMRSFKLPIWLTESLIT